jgi:hypothetical protein
MPNALNKVEYGTEKVDDKIFNKLLKHGHTMDERLFP